MKKAKLKKEIERLESIIQDKNESIDRLLGGGKYDRMAIDIQRSLEKFCNEKYWLGKSPYEKHIRTKGLLSHINL
jgi:hypothetical protein